MRSSWILFALVALGALLGAGCPPAPAKDYTPADLASLNDMTELMRVNAHYADPWFKRRTDTDFTVADFATMAKDAEYIAAVGHTLGGTVSSAQPEGFRTFAKGLEVAAGKWRDAAKAKDAAGVDAALEGMLEQCKGCHGAYR
jgi:cytochrome c556